jgi:RNA polymerase sigma-70 factor (ECF subfamily)
VGRADLSDEYLLRQYLDGNSDAFDELVRRHEDRIFALALRMLGQRADALEATQETFIAAFRRAGSFRGDSAFGTWLYRIGINACKDALRKRRDLLLDDEGGSPEIASPESVEQQVTSRIDVRRALTTLSEDYREAVVMHDLGGIPYEEIARLTGVPIGTVKSRISRGRRMLAEALEHSPGPQASKDGT